MQSIRNLKINIKRNNEHQTEIIENNLIAEKR